MSTIHPHILSPNHMTIFGNFNPLDWAILIGVSAFYTFSVGYPSTWMVPAIGGALAAIVDEIFDDLTGSGGFLTNIMSDLKNGSFYTFVLGAGVGAALGATLLAYVNPTAGFYALGAGIGTLVGGSFGYTAMNH